MDTSMVRDVVFLPGGIMPAAIQYAPLLGVLKNEIRPVLKDLELYAADVPAPGYQLRQEVEALKKLIDQAGLTRFHLVAYSGGGAAALAFAAAYPEMLISLALVEPAVIPSAEWLNAEREHMDRLDHLMALPPNEQMREFVSAHMRPGVQPPPPPPGEPPAWMAKRPAGLKALMQAFLSSKVDPNRFRQFHQPVYLAIGRLSNPIEERKAEWLADVFSDFQVEVYEGRHHFDPPQRAEPERFARALVDLWIRAEQV